MPRPGLAVWVARKHTTQPVKISQYQPCQNFPIRLSKCRLLQPTRRREWLRHLSHSSGATYGLVLDEIWLREFDLSSALELDWYENMGLTNQVKRTSARWRNNAWWQNSRQSQWWLALARPFHNGAQACELTWQIRGQPRVDKLKMQKPG